MAHDVIKLPSADRITSWKSFNKYVRPLGCQFLKRLPEFPDSVLISGCQRSGTTALANVLTQSDGMVNYYVSKHGELDAALILSGIVPHEAHGRYCFQTTYVNECYHEYFEPNLRFKMIWVIRNPLSVIYSMTRNWKDFALNDLFRTSGVKCMEEGIKRTLSTWVPGIVPQIDRACYAYIGKTLNVFELMDKLGPDTLAVVDYDHLVLDKARILPRLYEFVNHPYHEKYADSLNPGSVSKAQQFSSEQKSRIEGLCHPVYQRALELVPAHLRATDGA
jgi:hypothetical protein